MNKFIGVVMGFFVCGGLAVLLAVVIGPAWLAWWLTRAHILPALQSGGIEGHLASAIGILAWAGMAIGLYQFIKLDDERWKGVALVAAIIAGAHLSSFLLTRNSLLIRPLYVEISPFDEVRLTRRRISDKTGRENVRLGPENACYVYRSLGRPMRRVNLKTVAWFSGDGSTLVFVSKDNGLWEGYDRMGYNPRNGQQLVPATSSLREQFDADQRVIEERTSAERAARVALAKRKADQEQLALQQIRQQEVEQQRAVAAERWKQQEAERAQALVAANAAQKELELQQLMAANEDSLKRRQEEERELQRTRNLELENWSERDRQMHRGLAITLPLTLPLKEANREQPVERRFSFGPLRLLAQKSSRGERKVGVKVALTDWEFGFRRD